MKLTAHVIMAALILSFVLLCGFTTPVNADIYQWTDENGVRHYSNYAPSDVSVVIAKTDEVPYVEPTEAERQAAEREEILAAVREELAAKEAEILEMQQDAARKIEAASQKAEEAIQAAEALLNEADNRYTKKTVVYSGYYPYQKRKYPRKKRIRRYAYPHSGNPYERRFKHRPHVRHYNRLDKKHIPSKNRRSSHNVKKNRHVFRPAPLKVHRGFNRHPFQGQTTLFLRLK